MYVKVIVFACFAPCSATLTLTTSFPARNAKCEMRNAKCEMQLFFFLTYIIHIYIQARACMYYMYKYITAVHSSG